MVIPGLPFLSERQAAPATPEYKDESYAGNLLAIHGTFCGVALLSVILRLYVRVFMIKSVGVDDYIMVAASVSTSSICCCCCLLHQKSQPRPVGLNVN
jgi:hypothetical protein